MTKHLDPKTDNPSDLFNGMVKKERYNSAFGKECPICRGHGGWNLKLDAYGPGKHFQAHCSACSGYGYLMVGQDCAHEFRSPTEAESASVRLFRCEHLRVCQHCGQKQIVDSSD